MEIFVLFGSMTILLALSLPIGISLGFATALTLVYTDSVPLIMIAQNAFAALDSFPLLAIPFFMLAGSLMSYGGISKRLVTLANAMVGAVIGGLAMVTVTACMFFAAISGSGPATVSAIGSFMIPAMKAKKYDDDFAAALTAVAGSIGVIIPPSIPFVIYGVVSGVSVGEMFVSGIIPGIVIGLSLMALSYRIAKKKKYPRAEKNVAIGHAFKEAWWALMVPVIILGGIYGGIFTPTEAAVVASVYALFIGKYVYKELDFNTIYDAFKDAALVNGATTFMIGLSMSFAAFLAMEQVPARICEWMLSLSSSPAMILLIINILLLTVGCFVDNISSMIILTPILLPIVTKIGIDPVHFGLVMTVALATGFVTPPYGANLFVASAVSGVNMVRLSKAVGPFILVMISCLLLFTYIPSISMSLVWMLR
ncbi:MAG: TRAP transporter large permease [Synergistaceae bacterium]|jgi:C4-dicarboxylate transporter DctM subunit|nr:TRAP transporter large permease [Acidaminococcaceae bacterium]MCE5184006.1 TRAP transporter large permease [Synergistaceae bacterium]MDD4751288.1 TRAP transporter large permease [Synergistaceae bacterium]PKL03567.1 MAG: C4-dicarboxylate ABC transporter permease [Synergistetes bacterium HGW-Synergistetes-1]